MSFTRLKETFLSLPPFMKAIGLGSFVLAVSTILPWYADLDSYRIGDQFLGVTGPASFVGIAVLILSGISFWLFSYRLRERHVPRLPVREAIVHMFVAVQALFLLILVNSIYFHPKFGVNITLKESRFGMVMAFIGAAVLMIGGYVLNKKEIAEAHDEGRLEPLITLETPPQAPPAYARSQSSIRPSHIEVKPTSRPEGASIRKPVSQMQLKETPKAFLFGEAPRGSTGAMGELAKEEKEITPREEKPSGSGSFMIRTDL